MQLQEALVRLRDNSIETVYNPDGAGGLDDAGVQALAPALKLNTSMKTLSLYLADNLSSNGFKQFAEAIKGHPNLNFLSIGTVTPAKFTDANRQFFVDALEETYGLTNFNIGNFVDEAAVAARRMKVLLDRNENLRLQLKNTSQGAAINLYNELNDSGVAWLAPRLIYQTQFSSIRITYSQFSDAGIIALIDALKTLPELASINFQGNVISDLGAIALAELWRVSPKLRQVELQNNNIGDTGATAWANAIKTNTEYTDDLTLALGQNKIGDAGAVALAEALSIQPKLSLTLYGNEIGDDGAIALVAAYVKNKATSLSLDRNRIGSRGTTAIATALQNNTRITYLSLSDNPIGDVGAAALGELLAVNAKFENLMLSNTQITATGAIALAQGLEKNTNCVYVGLTGNLIGSQGAQALLQAMQNNTVSVNLDQASNGLSEVEYKENLSWQQYNSELCIKQPFQQDTRTLRFESFPLKVRDFNRLMEILKTNQLIFSLDFSRTGFTDANVQVLADVLKLNKGIKAVSLNSNPISDAGAIALAEVLSVNPNIENLYLSDCNIGDAGAIALANVLKTREAPLYYLHLGRNAIGNAGAEAIISALKENPTLVVDRSSNPMSQSNSDAIYQLFSKNTIMASYLSTLKDNSATELMLYNGQLSDKVSKILAEALIENTSLKTLKIAVGSPSRALTTTDIQYLATMLKQNRALAILDLSNNAIGDAAVSILAEALTENPTLRYFHLYACNITNTGAIALAEILASNIGLKGLSMDQNSIGDAGVIALAQALSKNPILTSLSLSNNQITDIGAQALIGMLEKNHSLIYIDLRGNSISQFLLGRINELLGFNQEYPSFANNTLSISQGETVVLEPAHLAILANRNDYTPIVFNVTEVERGVFLDVDNRNIIRFTSADIQKGAVRFQQDGSFFEPHYTLMASNRLHTTAENAVAMNFKRELRVPLLSKNTISLTRGEKTKLSTAELLATFDGVTPLPGLMFQVSNVTAGRFEYLGTGESITMFSQRDVMNQDVAFAHDGSKDLPSYDIQVSDGNRTSAWERANISFIMPVSSTMPKTSSLPASSTIFSSTQRSSSTSAFLMTISSSSTPHSTTSLAPKTNGSQQGSSSNTGLLIGLSLVSVFGVVAVIAFVILWLRQQRSARHRVRAELENTSSTLPMQVNPVHAGAQRSVWSAELYEVEKKDERKSTKQVQDHYDVVESETDTDAPPLPVRGASTGWGSLYAHNGEQASGQHYKEQARSSSGLNLQGQRRS